MSVYAFHAKTTRPGPTRHVLRVALTTLVLLAFSTRSESQIFSQDPSVLSISGDTVHESMVAIGPRWVINAGTHKVAFHDKQAWSTPTVIYTVQEFFGTTAVCCDPVAYYDPINNRYLVALLGNPHTSVFLMVSNGGDPTVLANWYKYTLNDPTFADYIGLGISDDKIVVGWQRVGTGLYIYEVLDRAAAYAGTLTRRATPITTTDGFYKPVRNITSGADIHLVAVTNSQLLYRTIAGPATTSVLQPSGAATVVVSPTNLYAPNGQQRDASAGVCKPLEITAGSGFISDVYRRGDNITVAWQVSKDYQDGSPPTSAVRTVRFTPGTPPVIRDDFTVGTPGVNYSYPSVAEGPNNTMFVGYDRLSANDYPSSFMIARKGKAQPSDLVHQSPEMLVQAGTDAFYSCKGHTTPCSINSWGDYSSLAVDEFATTGTRTVARADGGWSDGHLFPGTAIGTLNADYGLATISGRILVYSAGVESPRSDAQLELSRVSGGAGNAVAQSDGSGNVTFSSLPDGTYRLRTSWGATVAREARGGSGGSSQTVISSSEIEIVVSGSQVSSGNEFVINVQPTPQITGISPGTVNSRDPAFTLDVQGQQFSPHSVVRFNGRDKATTFVSAQLLRAQITHDDIAKPAWLPSDAYKVTVFTAGASGKGTSNAADLKSLEGFLVSAPTFPSRVIACPAGDREHVTVTFQAKTDFNCGVIVESNPPTATLTLAPATPDIRVWDAAQPFPPFFFWQVTSTGQLNGAIRTYTFDVGQISGCGQLNMFLNLGNAAWSLPPVEVRSFDLDPTVRGTVDQYDLAAFSALMNTSNPCGDFIPNGTVGLPDFSLWSTHNNHYFPRQVLSPNNGGSFAVQSILPITWKWGGGTEARVTLKLVDDSGSIVLSADEPDDGVAELALPCPYVGSNKKIEVVHHSVPYSQGQFQGSDQSNTPFTITGTCPGPGQPGEGAPTAKLPTELKLFPARPNPTTGDVAIAFDLPRPSKVRVSIYDLSGRLVHRLFEGERPAGHHDMVWNLSTTNGRAPAGVYFYRMQVGSWKQERRLTVR